MHHAAACGWRWEPSPDTLSPHFCKNKDTCPGHPFYFCWQASCCSRLAGQTLPVKQSYRLAKLIKAIDGEINVYDGERIKLCEKYGTLNKEKHIYEFEDEAYKSFETDINVLQSQEVELDIKLIDISDLELSAQDIINIEPFIEVITDD